MGELVHLYILYIFHCFFNQLSYVYKCQKLKVSNGFFYR